MKLKKLEVNSFAGISPESPVVIDFTNSKFVKLEGDMGAGKTSMLNALLVACGQLSKDTNEKSFVNNDTGKIDMNFSFVGKDRLSYEVRCTKSSFQLTYEGNSVPEPIKKMKELLGVVGISPMEIKSKPLKEIVRWLASYSNKSAEEFEDQLMKYKTGIKTAREARAQANKGAKSLNEYLSNEEMFLSWEESEKKYSKEINLKEISSQLDVAGKNSDKLLQAESKLKQLNERKASIEEQINRLTKEAEEVQKSIVIGVKFVEENKTAKKEYDKVKLMYDNAAQESINYNKWKEIKRKKSEKDEYETLAQKADSKEKEILQSLKELQAEILPDIKGVELVTEDTHEDGVMKKEGLYFDGKNVVQLSETEWYSLVMQIWRKYKVKIVVIDNMQSLGSKGIELLEKLSNDGAYILAAQMNREQKTLQINYE
jgi:DNA repair exonuclease SbcCD ATPase subunit